MNISVILSTYNAPLWLEKVFWGFSVQRHRNFELIVADDGSTEQTRETIARARAETGMIIHHVRQEDRGFRKCEILNKAILHAGREYLVFTDGDCIPRADFLDAHVVEAAPGFFLTGSAIRLPMSASEKITREDIQTGRCFAWQWLRKHGLALTHRNLKITARQSWVGLLNRLPTARANFMGCNSSAWRKDILAVNGFDHRMAWGGLDRELGVRLKNMGIRAKRIRYSAHVLHLGHERGYADLSIAAANRRLRKNNEKNKVVKTEFGINLLPLQDYTREPQSVPIPAARSVPACNCG